MDRVDTLEALSPGGSTRKIFEALATHRADASIVVVGHEPDLGALAGTLIGTGALPLKKAGACAIECEGKAAPGTGELTWFIPPRLLRRLGRKKVQA
jgi:phosphohistidine phosphatase